MPYIKLEDAINHIMNHTPVSCTPDFFDGQMDCVARLKSLPTADVVEVVRCKDCDIIHNKWMGCPHLNGLIPPPMFYCAYGERKEQG